MQRLIADQLADGGWNCDAPTSTVASYHSTICVLEGLLAYERATGELAHATFTAFAYPPRYHYDVLRGLDHLRDAGAAPDPRLADAIALLEQRRHADGTWHLDRSHPDALAFRWPESVGERSRWNTLRALRVLRWFRG